MIKVITGIRRCGKSVLLLQIIDELKELGIDTDHIIYLNLEDIEYHYIHNSLDLNKFVKEKITDKEKYYLFFDEIQMIEECERIFITCSNSKLLSSELTTLLSGRYISFRIAPFS